VSGAFPPVSLGPVFGLWSVCFPPALVRTARRLPVEALCEVFGGCAFPPVSLGPSPRAWFPVSICEEQ